MALTEAEIEEIMASGNADRIAEMVDELDAQAEAGDGEVEGASPEDQEDKPQQQAQTDEGKTEDSEKQQDEKGAASGAEEEDGKPEVDDNSQGEDSDNRDERYVESKSGGNRIPYSVLENARARAKSLESERNELLTKLSDLEQKSATYSKHLEKAGVDINAIQDGSQELTPEKIAEINELDPALGSIVSTMFEQLQSVQNQIKSAQPAEAVSPVELAIRDNADLKSWRSSDQDRWDQAVHFDEQLRAHPEWKNASFDDRFAEAVRLTKLEFGDATPQPRPTPKDPAAEKAAAQAKAEEKLKRAQAEAAPTSLTDIGKTADTGRSIAHRIASGEMSEAQIAEHYATLSPAAMERLIDEVDSLLV